MGLLNKRSLLSKGRIVPLIGAVTMFGIGGFFATNALIAGASPTPVTYSGCVSLLTGTPFDITTGTPPKCDLSTPISWSSTGTPGPAGPTGPAGPKGATGATGEAGASAAYCAGQVTIAAGSFVGYANFSSKCPISDTTYIVSLTEDVASSLSSPPSFGSYIPIFVVATKYPTYFITEMVDPAGSFLSAPPGGVVLDWIAIANQ